MFCLRREFFLPSYLPFTIFRTVLCDFGNMRLWIRISETLDLNRVVSADLSHNGALNEPLWLT